MIKNIRTKTKIRKLATRSTVSSVSVHDFRSLQEVNHFARELENEINNLDNKFGKLKRVLAANVSIAVTIRSLNTHTNKKEPVKFIKPDMRKLKDSFSIVEEYQEKLDKLDSVLNTITIEFKGERGVTQSATQLRNLQSKIRKKLDSAYTFLSKLASNHEPPAFRRLVDYVADSVISTFKDRFKSQKQTAYLVPTDKETILLTHYIHFKDFTTDEGNSFDLYLVINCEIDLKTSNAQYSVTTLRRFVAPGKFRGIKVKDKEEARVKSFVLLEQEGFSNLVERAPLNVPKEKLDSINWSVADDWIKNVKVEEDTLVVDFTRKVNQKNIDKAMNTFVVDFKTTLAPNQKMTVQKRKYKRGTLWSAEFILVLPDRHQRREIKLDGHKMRTLKNTLDITEKEAYDLVKYINSKD